MKLLKAIIRPNKVDDVKDALSKLNLSGMTVTEVRGHGKQKGHTAVYRGKEYNVSLLPKMQVEVVVPDTIAEEAIRAEGLEPIRTPIRGGTDGSVLSARGLPTPNIFTGGHEYHSVREWASVQEMASAAAVAVRLAGVWAGRAA